MKLGLLNSNLTKMNVISEPATFYGKYRPNESFLRNIHDFSTTAD